MYFSSIVKQALFAYGM